MITFGMMGMAGDLVTCEQFSSRKPHQDPDVQGQRDRREDRCFKRTTSTLRTRQELPARFSHFSLGLVPRVGTLDQARSL
jgi:hypothetical protein